MNIRQSTLENGLKIITAEMAEAASLTVDFAVGVGSRFEDFDKNGGVSHFLEHILFKGTEKYPSAQAIAEAVDAVGGYNNAYTTEDMTSFYIKVPAEHAVLAIDILADMIRRPLIDPEEVDRERDVIIEEMNVYRDDPARFVGTLLPGLIFPNNPLGRDIIGSEEVIKNVSASEIREYMKRYYRPDNMVVSIAGKVNHDEIVAQIRGLLGDVEPGGRHEFARVDDECSEKLVVAHDKPTAQAHFMIGTRGYRYGHPDEMAANLLTAVLGRGMSSRLFLNVRERQGLAYSVYAEHNCYVDSGMFSVYAGVNLDKINKAISSVIEQLVKISGELIEESELNKAKQQLKSGLAMSMEANSSVADRFGNNQILLGRIRTVDEVLNDISRVTREDVARVAKDMLRPADMRLAIIAPDTQAAAKHFEKVIKQRSE